MILHVEGSGTGVTETASINGQAAADGFKKPSFDV